ncbi:MAG: DUF2155 domain-containing protein [Alphaproteobacteria bacterium]|nr:DUF2155 domain-containing protein [Alphaproteobacteria bacterium]
MKRLALWAVLCGLTSSVALGEDIKNPVAIFAGLDKIMGITKNFEEKVGEDVKFSNLVIRAEVCTTAPITESPKTAAFVEIDEIKKDDSKKRIFSGWMFAESPGLNGLEHPVLDVWLVGCKDPNAPPPPVETIPDPTAQPDKPETTQPAPD